MDAALADSGLGASRGLVGAVALDDHDSDASAAAGAVVAHFGLVGGVW